jgi:hypothetical protein
MRRYEIRGAPQVRQLIALLIVHLVSYLTASIATSPSPPTFISLLASAIVKKRCVVTVVALSPN